MFSLTPEETLLIAEVRRSGQLSLPELTKVLKLHRSTLYYQLQSLVKKGILQEVKLSSRRSVYRLVSTERLEKVVEAQRQTLTELLLDSPRTQLRGKRPKLVFTDSYRLTDELMAQLGEYEVVMHPDSPARISPEAFVLRCQDADVAVTSFSVMITREMLLQCPNLKCIVTASISTEMIDVEACRTLGVQVQSLPASRNYKKAARAEFVFTSLFNVLRPLYPAAEALRLGQFEHRGFTAEELRGKIVGVVGVKREGREIIPLLRAFGCGVEVCNPDGATVAPSDVGVAEFVTLGTIFQECDVVIFPEDFSEMLDLGPDLMNATMRPRYFLFLSYSLKLHLDTIRELIVSRHITALALDYFADVAGVFKDFPRSQYRKIMNFPNVVITPEIGYLTRQSMELNNQQVWEILHNLELARQ
ncbi:MAG: D-3-phosphoglycerate dehydrogenase [Patescibacteria group bacterium]|nr:D-3-phosphoglycerate dehydrogenase [Patescibacteria group bacterium]